MVSRELDPNGTIQGKVTGILNERELVVNIGSSQGVNEGIKFKILANVPYDVIDPETGNKLGTIDREKVRVVATEVKEKFSICRTYKKRLIGGWNINIPNLMPAIEVPETLNVKDSQLPTPLSEEESYVKVGDRVIQVEGDDE